MMASKDTEQKRASGRKLQKRAPNLYRLPTTQIPARLRDGDDANEDVTAPSRAGPAASQYLNQSIFSMIAAAGSKADFNKRFDESSDSETDAPIEEEHESDSQEEQRRASGRIAKTSVRAQKHQEHSLDDRLLKASPKSSSTSSSRKQEPLQPTSVESPSSDRTSSSGYSNPRDAPVMSRLLTAKAEFQTYDGATEDPEIKIARSSRQRTGSSPATLLATRLMEIFAFSKPETVIAEYPCWLLQSVLLQGYLYLTKQHICFYAYLPRKSKVVAKTGYLSKRGRTNPKYKRYWFTLKGDVLSYYSNPSEVYFPQGNIDLRYGISASLTAERDQQKDCKDFSVTTDHRTYHFSAESAASAKEWVRSLQKTIFRSHNDGDSIKISLPVDDIIDIEESPVVDFAETVKVRVIESGDSYAIDEYFFSFFNHGKDALHTLGSLIDDTSASRSSIDQSTLRRDQPDVSRMYQTSLQPRSSQEGSMSPTRARSSKPHAGISGQTVPTAGISGDTEDPVSRGSEKRSRQSLSSTRRESDTNEFDRSGSDTGPHGNNGSQNRTGIVDIGQNLAEQQHDFNDAHTQSSNDVDTDSSAVPVSPAAHAHMSASQILTRSDVFHSRDVEKLETVLDSSIGEATDTEDSHHNPSAEPVEKGAEPSHGRNRAQQLTDPRGIAVKIDTSASETSGQRLVRNTSSPTLQELAGKVGSYPFARAGALAKYIQNRSSKMGKALTTESMSYLEKVTGMWQGGHKHYGQNEGIVPDDKDVDPEDEEANVGHGDRFRAHFALPVTEKLQATYFGYLHRVLPLYGKIYVSNRLFCFRSLLPGTRTRMILPLKDVENVDKEKGFRFGYHGLVLVIRGHEELFFEFKSADTRDDCTVTLLQNLESTKYLVESGILAKAEEDGEATAKSELRLLQEARSGPDHGALIEAGETIYGNTEIANILFDDPKASIVNFRPPKQLRITCLTIGSRGDVQPYIALCKGLAADGHKPRIATHAEFGPWVESHGIAFTPIGGDPAELMRICVENGMFTYSFLREASTKFRSWIDDLLTTAWEACQDCDLLIESPSAMAGIHIAEALNIPYFRAFTMPWTRTRAYPHAFAVPEQKIGGAYNYFSYVMFDNVFWKGIAGQVNRWRKSELGLQGTNLDKMQPNKVPFLYNFSPNVVAPPLDYSDWVRVTGYWFLDESDKFSPPKDLVAFIRKARDDKKKLVYIGFGSIVVSDPAALTETVVQSVLKADVRCILSKGWSDRLGDPASTKVEIPLPSEIFQIKSAPHDWLFPQVDCAVHHGGAGTTGASLRAGIPTVIKPFFGDQFFFGGRVEDLGVGILLRRVNVSVFARALWEACNSQRMQFKAKQLGERIRAENGVQNAIQALYRDLSYAETLVRLRSAGSKVTPTASDEAKVDANAGVLDYETEADLDNEESWAFVGDETEIDHALRGTLAEPGVNFDAFGSSPRRTHE